MKTNRIKATIAALAIAACATTAIAEPVPASFTYQGILEEAGSPVDVNSDFIVRLYNGPTFISQVTRLNQPVTDGQFQLDLNFTPALFDGTNYELEILVRSPAGVGSFDALNPRQPLTTTPYAFHANSADALQTPTTISGSEAGNLVTIDHSNVASGSSPLRVTRGPTGNVAGTLIASIIEAESDDAPIGVLGIADNFPIAGVLGPDTSSSNSAAVLGQILGGAPGGQSALWGLNGVSGNSARIGTDDHAADLTGDLRVLGDITTDFAPGSFDLATPIAYGFVFSSGVVANGTPNFSATWNAGLSRYEIEIDNEDYFFSEYVTVVTPTFGDVSTRTSSSGGRLLVYFENTASQNQGQSNFQFVTYKTAGAAAILGQSRPPLVPLNTPYTDADLNPNLTLPAPRVPIVIEQPAKSGIQRD